MSTKGPEDLVNQNTTTDWRQKVLPEILRNYRSENVYNADEMGLYFELLPNKSICLAGDTGKFHKDSKLSAMLLLCVNYTGQTKLTPLVVGKSRNPRCFKGVKSLLIVYHSNSSSWMTSKIFNNWLSLLNTDQLKKKQKIALLIDNAPCHNVFTKTNLSHIDIFFLPPNTTSVLQPLDQRIIHSFKSFYKKFLIKLMISKYGSGEKLKVNILNAIEIIVESWDKVTEKTINNCFS
ncbi:Tigger transposable element-derived protein 6, partial [Cucumispora dikerogammari]